MRLLDRYGKTIADGTYLAKRNYRDFNVELWKYNDLFVEIWRKASLDIVFWIEVVDEKILDRYTDQIVLPN